MDTARLLELRRLGMESAALSALIQLYERGGMSLEEWSHYAIVTLAKQNIVFFDKAVDAEKRAYPRAMTGMRWEG